MDGQRVVLVTGASSGFGKITAKLLAERGYSVFGTSRKPSEAEPVPGVEMLELDVRSDESVATCVDRVLRTTGHLDVLVNNAGYIVAGAAEETPIEAVKAEFETNLFGAHRMVLAALPAMRKQRSGRIINISSVAGFAPGPFLGIYSASKFAIEGYSEALRAEVRPFSIHVSLIEVGFAKTNIARNAQMPSRLIGDYEACRQRAFGSMLRRVEHGADPCLVAECVLRVAERKAPRLRYRVGREAKDIALGRWCSPGSLFERAVRKYFDLD